MNTALRVNYQHLFANCFASNFLNQAWVYKTTDSYAYTLPIYKVVQFL